MPLMMQSLLVEGLCGFENNLGKEWKRRKRWRMSSSSIILERLKED
jgi:hypothetical protein